MAKRFALRNKKGFYYCFWDSSAYCGPQLTRDPLSAKLMTAQGCGSVKKMLADPVRHGEEFERIAEEDLPKLG